MYSQLYQHHNTMTKDMIFLLNCMYIIEYKRNKLTLKYIIFKFKTKEKERNMLPLLD